MLLVMVLGICIGAVMGLTGAGGGILAVPLLVSGLGLSMQQAAPVAMVAVAAGALVGTVDGFRQGLVRYKAGMLMAACGIPVTGLGLRLAQALPQYLLSGLFAILLMLVAYRMFQQSRSHQVGVEDDPLRLARINAGTGKFVWTWPTAGVMASIGAITGLMTGLLGVGGGFLIVPLLRRFTHLAMPGIVATSLFLIALVGTGGVVNAVWHGAQVPAGQTGWFVGVMVLGMLAGRVIARRLSPPWVQRSFSMLLAGVCVLMCYKTWGLVSIAG